MIKKENENNINNNQDILDDDFFDSFSPSKKITVKKKKINELIINLKQNKEYLSSLLSINNREKLSKLYELILLNLTENNNNYVLSQLELIEILGQYLYDQNEFKSFYRQALPKLFDKFYLQNSKINDNIIQMFNDSINHRILNIEDYYPHIENISLEEDDDYKVIVLNFFYNQMLNNDNIIYEKIPKNIINIITNLSNDNNPDIIEISSKLMNIFEKYLNNVEINNDIKEEKNNNIKEPNKENDNNMNEISNISISMQNINYDDFMNNESNIYDSNYFNKEKNINVNNNYENVNEKDNIMNIDNEENVNNNNNQFEKGVLNEANIILDNNNNNIYNEINKKSDEEEKTHNEIKRDDINADNVSNNLTKMKYNNSNKKFNHKNRINRSRKLGVITKNKKENEEKNIADVNNNKENFFSEKKDKNNIEKNLENNFSENKDENNEQKKKILI